jgi:hypothetical protein
VAAEWTRGCCIAAQSEASKEGVLYLSISRIWGLHRIPFCQMPTQGGPEQGVRLQDTKTRRWIDEAQLRALMPFVTCRAGRSSTLIGIRVVDVHVQ